MGQFDPDNPMVGSNGSRSGDMYGAMEQLEDIDEGDLPVSRDDLVIACVITALSTILATLMIVGCIIHCRMRKHKKQMKNKQSHTPVNDMSSIEVTNNNEIK
eukprot:CAMPEP_0116880288 /NCGR_PEP_ID=MMETSP0463-20121206/12198_1 /TAXON_ID=181622 /ORGANISM="Strombidinopsis sp, Strain SopsisLIS2011" /LENGTH=101 /DNA_ID=CAMNT_0004530679 /DNA_START=275 /DNA_END=580 /DNA_ORIENTATION=-